MQYKKAKSFTDKADRGWVGGGVHYMGTKIAKAVADFYASLCRRKPSPRLAFNYTCDPHVSGTDYSPLMEKNKRPKTLTD